MLSFGCLLAVFWAVEQAVLPRLAVPLVNTLACAYTSPKLLQDCRHFCSFQQAKLGLLLAKEGDLNTRQAVVVGARTSASGVGMTAQTAPTLDSLQDMFPALERSFLQVSSYPGAKRFLRC